MSMNQNTQAHFTNQSVNQAINQNNIGLSGQSATQSVFGTLPEQVIASDCLIASKAGVVNIARAITECSTPELRTTLKRYLDSAIAYHESISNFMNQKGWYDSNNPSRLIEIDIQAADNALRLQS